MQRGFGFSGEFSDVHGDVVLTPPIVAAEMISHFSPTGRVLDPCKGDGAFWNLLNGADYCELQEGRDFFGWAERVDWIIGNPPYSNYSEWLLHSMRIADQIVYLIPITKAFNSSPRLDATYAWGGIAEIVHIGPGGKFNFPFNFPIGAVHYRRGHSGSIIYRHNGFLTNESRHSGGSELRRAAETGSF